MDTPFIHIGGEKITPAAPKMKVWRGFLKALEKDQSKVSMEEFINVHVDLIVLGFGKPEVNTESIDENLEISEVIPLARKLFSWIQAMTFERLVEAPNAVAEKD